MSAVVGPYIKAVHGRLPMRPWVRLVLVGLIIVGVVALITWLFVMPGPQKPTSNTNVSWSAGPDLKLPPATDLPGPSAQQNVQADPVKPDPGVPGPSTSAPPPMVQVMRVWGSEGGGQTSPYRGQSRSGPPGATDRAGRPDDSGDSKTELAQRLTPTANHDGEAEVYSSISLLLPEGVTFGCLPQSPIDTQIVGSVTCTIDEDVWSADGTNILLDKGSFVSGEIQRGLALGQDRAFILWSTVRSKRVYAVLNSPGVDQLGQMGVPGELDEHLWTKIKATLLLTGIEGLGQAGQNLASRGNGNSYVNFSNGQSLAQQALSHDINIPTTLWRGEAWPLRIRVQHNIFFHKAYNNVLTASAK